MGDIQLIETDDNRKTNPVIVWDEDSSVFDWNPVLPYPLKGLRNPVNLYLGSKSNSTHRSYLSRFNRLAERIGAPNYEYINWRAFDEPQTLALLKAFSEPPEHSGYSALGPSTVNSFLSIIRNALRYAVSLNIISSEQYSRVMHIKSRPVPTGLAGRMADLSERRLMFDYCDQYKNPVKRARDKAILALLFYSGLRRHEVGLLKLEHVLLKEKILKVTGKGGRTHSLEMSPKVHEFLTEWIEGFRGDEPGPLFFRLDTSGSINYNGPLKDIRYPINMISQGCGLDIRPHDTRRTFISELLDITDIKSVADLARHTNINQTAKYDRRTSERKREALQLLE